MCCPRCGDLLWGWGIRHCRFPAEQRALTGEVHQDMSSSPSHRTSAGAPRWLLCNLTGT